MKKIISLAVCILSIWSVATANTDFSSFLASKGVDTKTLLSAQTVSRDTVAQLLNLVDCHDCHRPTQDIIQSLTQSWWNTLRLFPGKNFDDVSYNASIDPNNNYYCISYVANKGYMNGYPRTTSPLCSGRFCGGLPITNADTIQTVFNITAKLFYAQYSADWGSIQQWLSVQNETIQRYFGLQDLAIINTSKSSCSQSACPLSSVDALQTYVKYCTFQPIACGMKEFPFAKTGQWPIAEMNILLQQNIFTLGDISTLNIENYSVGAFLIDIIGRVKERSQCVDTDDQDHDGIKDYADNCYLTYNPRQLDTDKDMIGDVCDDDIDNDGIKNPVGIVDDGGNIVYDSLIKNNNLSQVLGLGIQQSQIQGNNYAFTAKYLGVLKSFSWDFGDGKIGNGENVNHTYSQPGIYVVHLIAKDSTGKTIEAVSTVIIGGPSISASTAVGLLIKNTKVSTNTYDFSALFSGNLKDFSWDFGDGKTGNGETITHVYTSAGTYTVTLTAKDTKGGTVTATQQIIVGGSTSSSIQSSSIASLMPSKLSQQIGENTIYKVILAGIAVSDIDYVKIARGDGRTRELRGDSITQFSDTYSTAGGFLIQGTVYVKDGTKLPLGAYVTVLPSNAVTIDTIDNCLFIVNRDQSDDDKNRVGNSCDTDERIGLRIQPKPLTQDRYVFVAQYSGNVKDFTRYFGDKTTGSGEITSHTYRDNGEYTVRLESTTSKGTSIYAYTTVVTGGPRVTLLPSKLIQQVGEKTNYTIQLQGVDTTSIDYVNIQRGDGRTRQLRGQEITQFSDAYTNNGGYGIVGTVYMNNGNIVPIGSYVTIVGSNFCMPATSTVWSGHCDMNKDGTPDICDGDIDGDGVSNPLGIIRFEKSDCSYDLTNTNTYTTLINPSNSSNPIGSTTNIGTTSDTQPTNTTNGSDNTGILKTDLYTLGRDTCPFTSNPGQGPCKQLYGDIDGDSIPDSQDMCPTVPETVNGVNDTDGCPEYDLVFNFPQTKLQPGTCMSCPCQYAQNDSTLAPGDRVKAVLYDKKTNAPVTESNWYIVP